MPERKNALQDWLKSILPQQEYHLIPLTGDASFRRYYRLDNPGKSFLVMDAPPDKENLTAFVDVAKRLATGGVLVPRIEAANLALGFALIEDFGDRLLLPRLNSGNVDYWYGIALQKIKLMQKCSAEALPVFDKSYMLQELALFKQWFLESYLKLSLTAGETQLIDETNQWLSEQIAQQPQVLIHRDFHSRNLMVLNAEENPDLGVIDFQDAMLGPCTYDLISLIKDCYIQWPSEQVNKWVILFYHASEQAQVMSLETFSRATELTGLQRHLKVLGIFSRLYLRDNKAGYLNDLPLTLNYVMACLEGLPALKNFYSFMQKRVHLP